MKKNIALRILLLVFSPILLFCLWYFYGIFTPYNFFTAKYDIAHGKVRIINGGDRLCEPPFEERLTEKYGFQFLYECCFIDNQSLHNAASKYNVVIYDFLDKRNRKGRYLKFEKELFEYQ